MCGLANLPKQPPPVPTEQKTALPEQKNALPEHKTALPEQKTSLPETSNEPTTSSVSSNSAPHVAPRSASAVTTETAPFVTPNSVPPLTPQSAPTAIAQEGAPYEIKPDGRRFFFMTQSVLPADHPFCQLGLPGSTSCQQ